MPIPELHPVAGALASILIVVVAGVLTKLGMARPNVANPPPPTTDAVVLSATFADGALVRRLHDAIESLHDVTSSLRNCVREGTEEQARTTAQVTRLGDKVQRVTEILDDRLPHARDPH